MLVLASKSPSGIIASYRCTLLPPLLLKSNISLTLSRRSQAIRQNSTTTPGYSRILEDAEFQQSAEQDSLDRAEILALSSMRRKPDAWVALVDEYVPKSLRPTQNAGAEEPAKIPGSLPAKNLPALLSKARYTMPLRLDVLSYMAINQGRWDAVRWLFKSLHRKYQRHPVTKEHKMNRGIVPWTIAEPNPYGTTSLDDITEIAICFDVKAVQSIEGPGCTKLVRAEFYSDIPRPLEWLGQALAMLAHMILRAAESSDHAKGQEIMSFVLEMIAHLHHVDAVPRTLYTYCETSDTNESYKPPTLSLMAYRIMSALSDAAWKARDKEIRAEGEAMGAKNCYKGHEMPEPGVQPHIDKLGPEIWLDLILWCCVEGGYYTEAAWVVREMLKRKAKPLWSVIGWSEIRRPEEPKVNWSVRVDRELFRFHMTQIGQGFGMAGPREVPPLVDMGPWTVSREVILTLIDRLASFPKPFAVIGTEMAWCRELLSRNRSLALDTKVLKKAVLGPFISRSLDIEEAPEVADRVLALHPIFDKNSENYDVSPQSKILEESTDNEVLAPFLGLLCRTLHSHIIKGNVQGALRTFGRIQKIIDADRQRHIIEFAEDLERAERTGDEDQLISESINNIVPSVYPQIPAHILSAFLNLLTDAYLYDLGNWLLYSDEIDGPFIPRSLYSEPKLQGALLRFAVATTNSQLFTDVSEKLETPFIRHLRRTILRCQITLGKWDAAEDLLRTFQLEPGLSWRDTDIMYVARSVLRLDNDKKTAPESLGRAQTLLQQLIDGEFNPPYNLWQRKINMIRYWRTLQTIYLMLRTVPSCLCKLENRAFPKFTGTSTSVIITSEAFDVLLEGIVETQGSLVGLKLWGPWCRPTQADLGYHALFGFQGDRHKTWRVIPTLQTLRVLTRPLVRQGHAGSDEERMMTNWAVKKYKELGLGNRDIECELPAIYNGS
ncbi:MAG: hypothetical protein HETSPECPRED_009533 [Heterodermia speciosa]|uniref:Uncharacterized protein n=1 Tax=Heterodermia speciosa TaxID=116794 RepID=A0A8H3EQH8_9LECA|nr:MAG: hypothetical protein HETSPECPRED_009533 [Heterodermia speciosa]